MAEARARLSQADAFLSAARRAVDERDDMSSAEVAAALAVLAGIAASDAACCARLGARPRGDDHRTASAVLGTVRPHGVEMARDLSRLLARTDAAHYGVEPVSRRAASMLVGYAARLTERARAVVA